MYITTRLLTALLTLGLIISGTALAQPTSAKKKIIFLTGNQSHGWVGHAYFADCSLLAGQLNDNVPGVEASVLKGGWPKDPSVLDGAAAIIVACDGNGVIGAKANWDALDKLEHDVLGKTDGCGTGIAFIHYAIDVGNKDMMDLQRKWVGGCYEQHWSVNPFWLAEFKTIPEHPVTRGVKPFSLSDEWYYHMRFVPEMKGVTPVLTAVPPEKTREGKDGPHSGNPTVRSRKGMAEHVAWVYERPEGGRGFGTTGGHTHWSYANDQYRKLLLNAICWIAQVEIPADGVKSPRPTSQQMLANLAGNPPKDWDDAKTAKAIEDANK